MGDMGPIERSRIEQGEQKSRKEGTSDWNRAATGRREAPLSPEERAERRAVAKPRDGVGCRYGMVPDRQTTIDSIKQLPPDRQALLGNPNAVVYLLGCASRTGSKEFNDKLSRQRAEAAADVFRSDPRVKARIVTEGLGFQPAIDNGSPPNKDNRYDRVVLIDVVLEQKSVSEKKEDKRQNKPAEKKESAEKAKTEIPKEHARDYTISREKANSSYYRDVQKALQGLKGRVGMPVEATRQIIDASRYEDEMRAAKSVDEKLWKVRPMRGFLFDIEKPSEQSKVKGWLREGGYDVDKMFKEYVTHWLRKGVT